MARKVKLETELGNVRSHTKQVFEEFATKYAIHFAWGIGKTGDHKAGKALDLMAYSRGDGPDDPGPIRPGWNRQVAEYAWANRKRLGIDYVIYDERIISTNPSGYAYGGPDGDEWHDYDGESHDNHVHLSFEEHPPAYKPPTGPKPPAQGEKEAMPEELLAELRKLGAAVAEYDRKNQERYGALLKNVQQEDPRWRDLTARLDAIQAQLAGIAESQGGAK